VPDLRISAAKRALAGELRRLRELANMSGDEVASELHWSASKVSRIETNRIGIKIQDLNELLDLYNQRSDRPIVDDARRGQLVALSGEQEPRGWWNSYADAIDDAEYGAYIPLEDDAVGVRCWSPELIQGLLQTDDYASAIMEIYDPGGQSGYPRKIRRRIEVRMRRQEQLTKPEQKQFTFILDEATLLHRYGDAAVMRRQLAKVNEISRLPNVTIRVLALAGPHPVVSQGPFTLLEYAPVHNTHIDDVVYVEQLISSLLIFDEEAVHQYRRAFDEILREALDEDASRQLIAQIAEERWGTTTA
jgi:transcriptional regulator with XRE-family HTH domain